MDKSTGNLETEINYVTTNVVYELVVESLINKHS